MIKAIALDDEPLALRIIEHFCAGSDFIELEKTFTKPADALKHLRKYPVDLIFLDIHMPGNNGMELYKDINADVMVIFTTAHSEYALEGFNVNATDYLLKPYSQERFMAAVLKAQKEKQSGQEGLQMRSHLSIRADYKLHRIEFKDILMIESLDDYIRIHIKDNAPVTARISMKGILEELPQSEFIRVHRSYIIPAKKIRTIQNKTITIENFVIPIGDTYKDEINRYL